MPFSVMSKALQFSSAPSTRNVIVARRAITRTVPRGSANREPSFEAWPFNSRGAATATAAIIRTEQRKVLGTVPRCCRAEYGQRESEREHRIRHGQQREREGEAETAAEDDRFAAEPHRQHARHRHRRDRATADAQE
jgi:hypothetical protein